jgi:Double zinc ribbon
MTDSGTWLEVSVAVLLVALSAVLGYFVVQRLRAQRQRIVADLASSPVFADDRAFNQIRIARSELDVLKREGHDVPRAAELIDQAEVELRGHHNVDAVRLAQNAHQLLVQARQSSSGPLAPAPGPTPWRATIPPVAPTFAGGPRPAVDLLHGEGPGAHAAPIAPASGTGTSAIPEVPGRPPKNRMEAHFQMTLLVEDLAAAPDATGRAEAERLRASAQASYASTDYTEALRLALKGRRSLGARLETLGSGRPTAPPSPTNAPLAAPETVGRTCSQCGRPIRSDDQFCRGCGATNSPSACPRCRAEIAPTDTFCGRCGSPVS